MQIKNQQTSFENSLKADLHLHSHESDGQYPPSRLVQIAVEQGLELISLTDHDTVSGLGEARQKARELNCYFVDGLEVEATLQEDNGQFFGIHLLGYGIDADHNELLNILDSIQKHRVERAHEILFHLEKLDIELSFEQVKNKSNGQSLSRVHVARVLKEDNHVTSIDEAFSKLLGNGKPAYVPKSGPDPETLIDVIHDAGGKSVWAHPYYTRRDKYIDRLVNAGLDGIECKHSDFSSTTADHYIDMAREHDLFVTGGSDYHGTLEEEFSLGDWYMEINELPFSPAVTPGKERQTN